MAVSKHYTEKRNSLHPSKKKCLITVCFWVTRLQYENNTSRTARLCHLRDLKSLLYCSMRSNISCSCEGYSWIKDSYCTMSQPQTRTLPLKCYCCTKPPHLMWIWGAHKKAQFCKIVTYLELQMSLNFNVRLKAGYIRKTGFRDRNVSSWECRGSAIFGSLILD